MQNSPLHANIADGEANNTFPAARGGDDTYATHDGRFRTAPQGEYSL